MNDETGLLVDEQVSSTLLACLRKNHFKLLII